MATLIGKIPLLITDIQFFKATQGIEGRKLFDRFKQAESSIIKKYINEDCQTFLAYPLIEDDTITFFGKKNRDTPILLSELTGDIENKYRNKLNETVEHYNSIIEKLKIKGKEAESAFLSGAIKFLDDRFIFCYDDNVVLAVWGMQLKDNQKRDIWEICKNLAGRKSGVTGGGGLGSQPTPELPITITFLEGYGGSLHGNKTISKINNEILNKEDIPKAIPDEGYKFTGWNEDPEGFVINGDKEFIARFEPKDEEAAPPEEKTQTDPTPPWYKRLWLWFRNFFISSGCLKWLLWFLLLLLLLLLFSWLFKSCNENSVIGDATAINDNDSAWINDDPRVGDGGGIYDPGNPYTPVPTPPEYEGILPPQQGVLPPVKDKPEIIPGNPTIIANRLNILMENDDKSIMDFAKAFKEKYPDEKFKVVYYDNVVKRMQIEVPKEDREQLKKDIPAQFAPEYNLFIFDEALFESRHIPNDPVFNDANKSWYFSEINAFEGWDITMGSVKVVVAIVDNGFNLKHPELSSKVVQPYNVWKHSKDVFPLEIDHGTHVAGTALAIANNGKGISGIAPNCKFMPIQVANDKGLMTTTSVLDGILYALYQGADVVNVSLGSQFTGLSQYPVDTQKYLIQNHFKEEERLWQEIMRIAAKHNATVVVAAGNDNVLAGIDAIQRPELFITVSAVDKNNSTLNKANFSNYGAYSTISAPGVGIYSTVGANGYETMDGTSMAAPIVTGAVALMKSVNPNIPTKQIICILQTTGQPANGNIGKMLQLDMALKMVQSGTNPDCKPTPSSGDVQILLSWNNYNDLDLICTDPKGETVYYKNRSVTSGGQLEIDMNVEYPDSKAPIENIFWKPGTAPPGTYNVYVLYYGQHEANVNETNFSVKLKIGNKVEEFTGNIKKEDKVKHIGTFTLGNAERNTDNANTKLNTEKRNKLEQERERLKQELDRVNNELQRLEAGNY